MARKTEVAGSVVRSWATSEEGKSFLAAWAAEKDTEVPTVGARGKFNRPLLDAFHKANPRVRYTVGHVPTRKITGTRLVGDRKQTVTVAGTIPELRQFAKDNGLPIGDRGVIAQTVRDAFVARPRS